MNTYDAYVESQDAMIDRVAAEIEATYSVAERRNDLHQRLHGVSNYLAFLHDELTAADDVRAVNRIATTITRVEGALSDF